MKPSLSLIQLWNQFGKQAIKFCAVGAIVAGTGTGMLYAFTEYLHIWYIYSNWIATILSQIIAFLGYKYWAFILNTQRAAYTFGQQFVVHWVVWAIGLAIGTGILYSLTTYGHVWYILSSIVATGISATSNFLSHKFWTYRPEKHQVE